MSVNFTRLWKKARAAPNETEFVRSLAEILSSRDGRKFILTLNREDAGRCIDTMDYALTTRNLLRTSEKQAFFDALRRLSEKHIILPDAMVITDGINYPDSGQLQTSGGFADIKQGLYKGRTVAVKITRVGPSDDFDKIRKRFCKEVVVWNSLSHPNILELVGVLDGFKEHRFAMVSEWMKHGNIMEYIRVHATNRLSLLHGAVKGLKYLHDANLVHGDLKGANILMTNDTPPTACLADFGFTTMVLDPHNQMSSSLTLQGGTMSFMAPELLAPSTYGLNKSVPTREADIYAFGLVIFQVLTGEQPFRNHKPQELAHYVALGDRPDKPQNAKEIGFSNSLWWLMQICWDKKIEGRPPIHEVVEGVGNSAAKWHTNMPPSPPERREDSFQEESDELKHRGIFEAYESETPLGPSPPELPPPKLSPRKPSPPGPAPSGHSDEEYEVVTRSHLYKGTLPPPTTIPGNKCGVLRCRRNKSFERKSGH